MDNAVENVKTATDLSKNSYPTDQALSRDIGASDFGAEALRTVRNNW